MVGDIRVRLRYQYPMQTFARWATLTAWLISAATGWADGKVFARPEAQVRVEIPNQQALIYHRDGIECLVIETAFLGAGTNFGWVVPLPAEPKVEAVSESFFPALRAAFQPRLLHYVHHYYLGVLFVCGVAWLAWRSFKDDADWGLDLPLCLLLALGVGFLGKSPLLGGLALVFLLAVRLFTRSSASFTIVVLVAMLLAIWITTGLRLQQSDLVQTLSADSDAATTAPAGVTVLSVQRAGLFEATTLRGTNPRAVLDWLENNGFAAPPSVAPVMQDYVQRGWVFVASKIQRENSTDAVTAAHPLAFTFATDQPIYPLKLTGVDNGNCSIDLYVFGEARAAAPHFRTVRCDRVAKNMPPDAVKRWKSWLRPRDSEVLNHIGPAAVGTLLSATLTPRQMETDAQITWQRFSSRGATVYSRVGAAIVALNVAVPLGTLGWLLVGVSRGGWGVDDKFITRWRGRIILVALIVGLGVFWLLPKVNIILPPMAGG